MMITTCRILWMPDSAELCGPDGPAELAVHDVASRPAIAAAATRRSATLFRGMQALCAGCLAGDKDNAERTQSIASAFHEPVSCCRFPPPGVGPPRVPVPPREIRPFP